MLYLKIWNHHIVKYTFNFTWRYLNYSLFSKIGNDLSCFLLLKHELKTKNKLEYEIFKSFGEFGTLHMKFKCHAGNFNLIVITRLIPADLHINNNLEWFVTCNYTDYIECGILLLYTFEKSESIWGSPPTIQLSIYFSCLLNFPSSYILLPSGIHGPKQFPQQHWFLKE